MTRFLSQTLGAEEPLFSQHILQLEQAAGAPSADIRLTTEMVQQARAKIAELGLDPNDTTGAELYSALQDRLRQDEQKVRAALQIPDDASPSTIIARIQTHLENLDVPKSCFALKSGVAKRLLRNKPPKNAMRRLGYRSLESMLKHESAAQLLAAAQICESPQWLKSFHEQYTRLTPSDFEPRHISFLYPRTRRWTTVATQFAEAKRHNLLVFKELGAVVMLPMKESIDGLAITTMLLILNAMNDLRAYSSFARLQQVKPNFGEIIQKTCDQEPFMSAQIAGRPMPWRVIQRFYAKFQHVYHPGVFEPHVQPEDLQWLDAEDMLAALEPTLKFWQGTAALAVLHENQPVSFNALDVALAYCNHLSFSDRIVHFLRDNVWHELMMRYLNQGNLEAAVQRQLSNELIEQDAEPMEPLAS